jgi:hypothetical protein
MIQTNMTTEDWVQHYGHIARLVGSVASLHYCTTNYIVILRHASAGFGRGFNGGNGQTPPD